MINAINAKAVVIEIDGALKKDMDSELKKQLKTQKKAAPIKNLGKGVGIISAVGTAMALINPVTWIAFGGASLASVLAFTIGGTAVAGMPFECSSVKITKALMKEYRVTQEELHMQAMENMKKDGYAFRNMKDIFADFLPVEIEKTEEEPFVAGELYVLTNKQKCWGAAGLLYQDWLKEQLGNISCYIMPSSVHETIFVPVVEGMDAKALNQMVVDVNRSHVAVQERLSDHCYLYNGKTQTICSCE